MSDKSDKSDKSVISNIAARTDKGLVRTGNEDCLIMADLTTGRSLPEFYQLTNQLEENALLIVVSDGVGGVEDGEVAGELTVLAIKETLMRLSREVSPYSRLVAAVEEANKVVWELNQTKTTKNKKKMAATVTAALIEGDHVFIAEVGDSRAYLIRSRNIKQVTTDQSFVAQLLERGVIKPEQALRHPRKHVILQAVGANEAIKVAVSMFRLQRGDTLLLCTNGLSDMISAGEMLYFSDTQSPKEACKMLTELAKQRGGRDNITIILSKFDGEGLTSPMTTGNLTGVLETLSSYDPDQKVEKSHTRTSLLGNSSLVDKLQKDAKPKDPNSLGAYPGSDAIIDECESMIEYINFCQQLLTTKPDQIKEATKWLEDQGKQCAYLPDMKARIESGLRQLVLVRQTISNILQAFEENPKR